MLSVKKIVLYIGQLTHNATCVSNRKLCNKERERDARKIEVRYEPWVQKQ
jgi:hypothetical protein